MKPDITIRPTDNDKFILEIVKNATLNEYAYDTIEEVFEHILSSLTEKALSDIAVRIATKKEKAMALKAWKYSESK